MVNLYTRSESPFWWAQATIGGKVCRWSTKTRDKTKAQDRAMAEYKDRVKLMDTGLTNGMSLEACLDRYVGSFMGTDGSSFDNLRYRADKILGRRVGRSRGTVFHLDGRMPISSLTTQHVSRLREARQKEGMANASINAELRCLQRAYVLAKTEWGQPVKEVHFRSLKTKAKSRYLQSSELDGCRSRLSGRSLALFEVLVGSGIRLREATTLEWNQIDFERKQIEVYRSKTSKFDIVPLAQKALDQLSTLKTQSRPFVNEAVVVRELRRVIHLVCNKDPRREKATIHSLRDTFASTLVTKGMSLYQVSKLLGHSSLTLTMKYAHLENRGLANEARRLIDG